MNQDQETYLGDGLYARLEAGMIRLRAPRVEGNHLVYLEPEVYLMLRAFAKRIGFEK